VKRKKFLYLTTASTAFTALTSCTRQVLNYNQLVDTNLKSVNALSSPTESITVNVSVDWSTAISKTTSLVFGSNDYEITAPKKAADPTFQNLLAQLNIPLIRIHHAKLVEKWSDSSSKSWDEAKIQACYDASYSYKPQIVQNITRWPSWMKQDSDGLLDVTEYDNYAHFCGELVRILNQTQNRQITYWEPFNELDKSYKDADKLDELWKIYNLVATRMKQVDSQIKVGGPALTWDDSETLKHFLSNCSQNVDFISWHRYASSNVSDRTSEIMAFTPKYGEQTRKFRSIVNKELPERKIPLFLSEYNINYAWDSGETRQNTHVGAVWFASVLKHLAEAEIDLAASWHLKDNIYGMIDRQNNLRPSATVFAWAIQFLNGMVMQNQSDRSMIEALPVQQNNGKSSLLLINKSAESAKIKLTENSGSFQLGETKIHSLDANKIKVFDANKKTDLKTLALNPHSLLLLRS
jgi:Glycosyl hydrolases family 39